MTKTEVALFANTLLHPINELTAEEIYMRLGDSKKYDNVPDEEKWAIADALKSDELFELEGVGTLVIEQCLFSGFKDDYMIKNAATGEYIGELLADGCSWVAVENDAKLDYKKAARVYRWNSLMSAFRFIKHPLNQKQYTKFNVTVVY